MIEINKDIESLKKKSEQIDYKDARKNIFDLQRAMGPIGKRGIGLSGPQINVFKRVAYFNWNGRKVTMVNPKITKFGKDKYEMDEFCLSIPNVGVPITRSNTITVNYIDYKGDKTTAEFNKEITDKL